MIARILSLIALAGLAGCVQPAAPPPAAAPVVRPAGVTIPPGLRSISYSTSPCFGACPVYAVTVNADGSGLWEGQRFVAVTGERAFRVSPEQFAAFARALQPMRPATDRRLNVQADCARFATDLDGVDVRWEQADGRATVLSAYFGCDMEANAALFDALRAAPKALPIAAFIGPAAR